MNRREIGEKIRKLREERGYNRNELANKAGLSPTYIPELERGEKCPTVETLDYICFALGITLRDFFTEEKTLSQDKVSALSPKQKEALNDFLNSL